MRILLLASIAAAAVVTAPAQAAGQFRGELHAGWDRVSGGGHDDGILYGVGLGYDYDIAKAWTLGVEANVDDSSIKECATSGTGASAVRACASAGRDLGANLRLGYKTSPQGTLYALAGYTNARAKGTVQVGGGAKTSASENLDGVRLGIGYQHDLGKSLYLKGEYRYSNYEHGGERHQLLTGVGLHF